MWLDVCAWGSKREVSKPGTLLPLSLIVAGPAMGSAAYGRTSNKRSTRTWLLARRRRTGYRIIT